MSEKRDKVYRLIEQGVSDAKIIRRAHISAGSLAAYKANYTRKHQDPKKSGREDENPIRDRVIALLDRGVDRAKVYEDRQLKTVPKGTITAYIAHWSRDSYK